jgi:hypothetical protein
VGGVPGGGPQIDVPVLGQPQLVRLSQNSFVAGESVKLGRGRLWNQLGVTWQMALTAVMCFNGANHFCPVHG